MALMSCCVEHVWGCFGSMTTSVTPVHSPLPRTSFHALPPSVDLYKPRSPPEDQSGPLGSHKNCIRVARVDQNFADVFTFLQPHVFETRTRVVADVDSVAETDMTSAIVFARSHPNRVAIARVNRDTTDGVGAVVLKNRIPSRARVGRFPDVARCDGDIPGVGLLLINGQVGNPPRHQRRTDAPQFQTRKRTRVKPCFFFLGFSVRILGSSNR